jgi:hypothetical protein
VEYRALNFLGADISDAVCPPLYNDDDDAAFWGEMY